MKTSTKPFTYDDYLALPDDGKRYEIIDGELTMTPAPLPRHQEVLLALGARLLQFVDSHSLGKVYVAPIDVALSMVDIVQPDVLFIARDRIQIVARKNVVGIPDLVIEILSPSSSRRDREEKLSLYQRFELPEYWIVDPDTETIEVYFYAESRLEKVEILKRGEQLHSRQIPGLVLEVTEVFKY
jgi:Uma2 family endonuclease